MLGKGPGRVNEIPMTDYEEAGSARGLCRAVLNWLGQDCLRGEGHLDSVFVEPIEDGEVHLCLCAEDVGAFPNVIDKDDVEGEIAKGIKTDAGIFLNGLLVLGGEVAKDLHGLLDFCGVHVVGEPEVEDHLPGGLGG